MTDTTIELKARELLAVELAREGWSDIPVNGGVEGSDAVRATVRAALRATTKALTLQPPSTDTDEDGRVPSEPGSRPSDGALFHGLHATRVDPSRVDELEAAADEMMHALHNAYFRFREFEARFPKTGRDGRLWQIFYDANDPLWEAVWQHRDLLAGRWAPMREAQAREAEARLSRLCSDSDGNPEGEKPQALSAEHDSAVAKPIAQPISDRAGVPTKEDVARLVEAAYREGWRVNAIPADEHEAGLDYVNGCENVDWKASEAAKAIALIPSTSRNDVLEEAARREKAAADIEEMIRLRNSRSPSIMQMQAWIEALRSSGNKGVGSGI